MNCKGCAYAVLLGGKWYCDYLMMTGRCRPCPPGEGCTVRRESDLPEKGNVFMRRRALDMEEEAREQ